MLGGSNNNQMHPDDTRNMMLFFAVSLLIFVGYYNFVVKPKSEALKKAEVARQQVMQNESPESNQVQEVFDVLPRTDVLAKEKRISISNDSFDGTISTKGGRIDDISLKNYFTTIHKEEEVTILSPARTALPRYIEHGWVANGEISLPSSDTVWSVQGNDTIRLGQPVTFFWENGRGLRFERIYSLDERYMITLTQKVTNRSGAPVSLHPYGLVSQRGIPADYQSTWIAHEGPIAFAGKELHEISYSNLKKGEAQQYTADQGWLGITDKYWLTALIPPQGETVNYRFAGVPAKNAPNVRDGNKKKDFTRYQTDYTGPEMTVPVGESVIYTSHIFVGAKEYSQLRAYEDEIGIPQFNLAVNFGWFWFLSKPFFYALHYLGQLTGNFGLAIIIMTIVIRSSVFPLTNVAYVSAAKMKKLAPQQVELRKKHGDDKAALQKELMELYQKEGVNPMGCIFPMIVQIPVFFALYKVLFVTIEMRHAPFFGWIKDLSAPDPTSWVNFYGLLPYAVPESFPIPVLGQLLSLVIHIGVWPTLMLVAFMMQKKLNPPPQDQLQRDMANYFPFIMAIMLGRFASGLVIYWTFSAYIGLIQQIIIMRKHDVPIYLFGQTKEEEELEEAVEHGPGVHPLVEMAEHEVEDAMFGEHEDVEASKEISPPKRKPKKKKK